jgi:hypothetical protein
VNEMTWEAPELAPALGQNAAGPRLGALRRSGPGRPGSGGHAARRSIADSPLINPPEWS